MNRARTDQPWAEPLDPATGISESVRPGGCTHHACPKLGYKRADLDAVYCVRHGMEAARLLQTG